MKFADHETESPLDVICYSGDRCPYMNITALEEELKSKDLEADPEAGRTTETVLTKPTVYDYIIFFSVVINNTDMNYI